MVSDAVVEDEADVRARESRGALAEYQAKQMRKRSQAVQRDLPRPDEPNGAVELLLLMKFPCSSTKKPSLTRA